MDLESSKIRLAPFVFLYSPKPSYPDYGDFLMDMVLAKVLRKVLKQLGLGLLPIEDKSTWSRLFPEQDLANTRLKEFRDIADKLWGEPLLNPKVVSRGITGNQYVKDVIGWKRNRDAFLTIGSVRLIDLIWKEFGIDPTEIFRWKPSGEFIGIRVQTSEHNPERNPAIKRMLRDIEPLWQTFPDLRKKIFGHSLQDVEAEIISATARWPNWLEIQSSQTFDAVIDVALECNFCLNRMGGGISVPILFSSMPCLIISGDVATHRFYGTKRRMFGQWSLQRQIFLPLRFRANNIDPTTFLRKLGRLR